jgi:hypothetical protein
MILAVRITMAMIRPSLSVCALLTGLCCASGSLLAQDPSGDEGLQLTAPRIDRSAADAIDEADDEAESAPPARVAAAPPKVETAQERSILAAPQLAQPAPLESLLEAPAEVARQRRAFSSYIFSAPAADEASAPQQETIIEAEPPVKSGAEPTSEVPARELNLEDASAMATAEIKLSPEMEALGDRIDQTLTWYYDRPENVAERSVWGVMHALIAYGVDTQVIAGNRKVNAIGWVCYNGPCRGQQLFYLQNGQLRTRQGPGVQGHHGQFLAMLAQSRVKEDFPLRIEGQEFTVADLIEYEKRTCYSKTELTFKLIALSHYLSSHETWKNDRGEQWNLEKLINEELAQPIVGAACGGTHRLMGISYAVNKRQSRGEAFTGEWLRAQKYERDYQNYLVKLQNRDGSFSTDWFAGRADNGDEDRKVQTTGHMLEWLVYSLPDDKLQDPRVVAAVNCLNDLLWKNRTRKLEIGPQGHALHALVLYQQRLYGAKPGQRNLHLAKQPGAVSEK